MTELTTVFSIRNELRFNNLNIVSVYGKLKVCSVRGILLQLS